MAKRQMEKKTLNINVRATELTKAQLTEIADYYHCSYGYILAILINTHHKELFEKE